jgi:hypothetical protein
MIFTRLRQDICCSSPFPADTNRQLNAFLQAQPSLHVVEPFPEAYQLDMR